MRAGLATAAFLAAAGFLATALLALFFAAAFLLPVLLPEMRCVLAFAFLAEVLRAGFAEDLLAAFLLVTRWDMGNLLLSDELTMSERRARRFRSVENPTRLLAVVCEGESQAKVA